MVFISLELTRVDPDRKIFSINVELTSTFFTLQRFGPLPLPNFIFFTLGNIIPGAGVLNPFHYVMCSIRKND